MLYEIGIIRFSVGSFFSTMLGYVEARRLAMVEGAEAIAEAIACGLPKEEAAPIDLESPK